MKASKIRLSNLTTYENCEIATEAIEKDHINYYGDIKSWLSGHVTKLQEGPRKKISAIVKKWIGLLLIAEMIPGTMRGDRARSARPDGRAESFLVSKSRSWATWPERV